ncbi:PREDICTED: matrix extracellular phosphoglycoprotein [Mesitornis unicolor]|uniref:matrix extracellular phosphoglycoprotein n=1 Tax=Mesitornis unicolor TaxID=54374 RepID=UPI000528421C|nr:PREDICTED: matrix extracellular phosphoglycoprotein [Mesitornis unicolor]
MQTALLCLCLLSTVLSVPVPPLPRRAARNCVGQHRILLKGCNAKHGFYVFKYVYSFSTRRNQTQIEKEEAARQSTGPSHQPGKDNAAQGPTEDRSALERHDYGGTDMMENRTGLKTENRSSPAVGEDTHGPRPGTSTQARSGISVASPTPDSSEGSGDLDLVVEVDSDVSILPQGGHTSGTMAGNRSGIGSGDGDDSALREVPVERAMTAGRERVPATGGAGNEGSGKATIPSHRQEGAMQGTVMERATLTSVTEKMDDVQVNAKGVDEYAYIPDSGIVTITQEKVGSTAGGTSFTQISPDTDNEVNIFIGRANLHMGEQETTLAGATVRSKDDSISTMGTSSPMPRLGSPKAQPPQPPQHIRKDSHPTADDEDGATIIGDGKGPVAPRHWRVAGGDVTIPTGAGGHGDNDKEVRGERQRFRGRLGHPAVTTPHQGSGEETAAAIPAGSATVASPEESERDCTTTLGTTSDHKAGKSTVAGRGGSREVGPATAQPRRESQSSAGAKVWPEGAGLEKPPSMDKMLALHGKAGNQASSRAQGSASGHGNDAKGRLHTTKTGGSPRLQAGGAGGGMAVGEGQEWGRDGGARVVPAGAGSGHLPGHRGRRLGSAAQGAFTALGHSRQVDQVKRANELHVREQAFYALSRVGNGPSGPYAALGSADSSQSSEGEQGSHSDSRQMGLQPSGWGAPGHLHSHWSQGAR